MSSLRAVAALLRHPDYGLYTLTNGVSLIGLWMQRVAIGWLTWELTGSGTWLGIVAFADLFPSVLIGLVGGVAADRLDRIRVIMVCQGLQMTLATGLGVATLAGVITIEGLVLAVFVGGVIVGFNQPSRLALVPRLVPEEQLGTAVALNSIVFNLARFAGPAVAGVVIVASDVGWAFLANAVSYLGLLAALVVIRGRRPGAGRDPEAAGRERYGLVAEIGAGLGYVVKHQGLGPLIGLHLCVSMLVRPIIELLPGFADRVFNGGADTLALLTSTVGVGAVIGGWTLARRSAGTAGLANLVLVSVTGGTLSVLVFTATDVLWIAIPAIGAFGAFMVAAGIATQTIIQLAVDRSVRGRVLSLHGVIFRGGPAIGALAMGVAGDLVGLRPPLLVGCVLALGVLVLVVMRRDRIRAAIEGRPSGSCSGRSEPGMERPDSVPIKGSP